jgi:hypothetical protein
MGKHYSHTPAGFESMTSPSKPNIWGEEMLSGHNTMSIL